MKSIFPILSILTLSAVVASPLYADESAYVTRAEYDALVQRLSVLEQSMLSFQSDVANQAAEVAIATRKVNASAGGSSIIDDVVSVIHEREEDAFYPWMEASKWDQLKVGMSEEQVIELLGEPTMKDPSMHKKIDNFYTYQGRRVASGKRVRGVVRFYRGKVKNFDLPDLSD